MIYRRVWKIIQKGDDYKKKKKLPTGRYEIGHNNIIV